MDVFVENGLNTDSIFLDIGSGFGNVVLLAASYSKSFCYGYEIVENRVEHSENIR